MQICPDPLQVVRSVESDQQWCVTLPACYPTILPYRPSNVEYNDKKESKNIDKCTNITDSLSCTKSELIQRLRHKIDLYQSLSSSSSNNTRQNHQHLLNTVKQYVSNDNRRDQRVYQNG